MADTKPYPVALPAEAASHGIEAGYNAYKTPGILYGDGQGGIRTAQPGTDYGYPLIQGNGPPGGSTVAGLGQHYFDMAAAKPPYEYICVGYTAFGFVWTVYGDTGAGFQVLGRFASLEALEAAVGEGLVPKPSPGDAYFIGDVAPYDMYFWDIMTQSWAYYGPLGGAGGGAGDVTGIPPHGDAGQVLKKLSDADYDVGWGDAYTLPMATVDVLGGVKSGGDISVFSTGAMSIKNGAVTRAKLAQDALYSPITSTKSRAITVADIGYTIYNNWNVEATFTLTAENSANIPRGAEIAFMRWGGTADLFIVATGVQLSIAGNTASLGGGTLKIPETFGMIALKKVSTGSPAGDNWLVTGPVEVVT